MKATMLDEAGLSARVIADQLGHARPSMTQDVYMGRKVVDDRVAEALEDALGKTPPDEVPAKMCVMATRYSTGTGAWESQGLGVAHARATTRAWLTCCAPITCGSENLLRWRLMGIWLRYSATIC